MRLREMNDEYGGLDDADRFTDDRNVLWSANGGGFVAAILFYIDGGEIEFMWTYDGVEVYDNWNRWSRVVHALYHSIARNTAGFDPTLTNPNEMADAITEYYRDQIPF